MTLPPVLSLRPETIFRRTLWVIGVLVAASLGAAYVALERHDPSLHGLSDWVHLDKERNLPTLFSMVQLLGAGTVAWKLGVREPDVSFRRLWCFLALGLMWIGLDEALTFHERLNRINIGSWRKISYFHFAWVLPAFLVVAVCGGIMLKLLRALPKPTAWMFALSGALFVAGAIGMEMLGGHFARLSGRLNWSYTICYTLEELLEMLGPALFIRTALRHAQQRLGETTVAPAGILAVPEVTRDTSS
jgi:hypothetical protein